jgi:L-threonylcarbamoyladenylate synthase
MSIEEAKQRLLKGEVVGIPTETVYGLAADITQPEALHKIFATKERPFFDPLIIHIDSIVKAQALSSHWSELHQFFAEKLWPGPMTLITKKALDINPLITSGLDEVGLRIPNHPLCLELLQSFKGLAAPSANKFGKTSPTQAQHVLQEFNHEVFVLDGGDCEIGIESTVMAIASPHEALIYRPGHYTKEFLETLVKTLPQNITVRYAESPVAPGQLMHHYMPSIPVLTGYNLRMDEIIHKAKIALQQDLKKPALLELGEDPILAARLFYQKLRELSDGHDCIVIPTSEIHQSDPWVGIMNRLNKAKSFKA